jgi:ABC-type phosphate transport system permease subunit
VTAATSADPAVPAGSADDLSRKRPLGDRTFQVITLVAGLLVLAILILIAESTSQQASSWFSAEGISGIFSTTWNPSTNHFGALSSFTARP